MTFKTQLTTDLSTFLNSDEFAESAVYTPTAGDAVSCSVFLDYDVAIQPLDYDARVVEVGTTIEALFSDVGEPEKGSTFSINSVTYTVVRIQDNDKVFVKMVVK